MTSRDPFDEWAEELTGDLVEPLAPEQIDRLASALASTAAAAAATASAPVVGAPATAAAGVSIGVKAIAVATLAAALTVGGAATGLLPGPVQDWVADLVDRIGIHIPHSGELTDLPDVTVPAVTVPVSDATVPTVTVPDVTVPPAPGVSIP